MRELSGLRSVDPAWLSCVHRRYESIDATMTMTTDSDPAAAVSGPGSSDQQRLTLRSLILRHKRASAALVGVLLVVIAVTVVTTISNPSRQPLSDSATCSQWAAAAPAQKIAYSHVYINEYGAFPNTDRAATAVEMAIDKDCTRASYLGEADDVSILASLRHAY